MRFNRLDILRYGALTDRTLIFRPDARLHVIYGPNEAGKSSALAAISDLMFGFPTAAEYSFLHEANALRVGADITGRDGNSLSFRRRRGRKNTLLANDAGEASLPEDALAAFQGSLTRDIFERAFGLNSERLRLGAAEMLKGSGEIGSLLFSAASGLLSLTQLKQSLDGEADAIYAPRRSKDRLFYQALDRHEEAKKAERINELKAGDWKRLLADAADIEAQLAALETERRETRHTLDRLRTLKKLEPLLREIDTEEAQLSDFADLAPLSSGYAAELAAVLGRRDATETEIRAAEAELERIADEIAATPVDQAARDAASQIMVRYAETADYRSKMKDMPRVSGEIDDFDARLVQIARRLGLADMAEIERVQPSDADLARIRKLVSDGVILKRDDADIGRRLGEDREQLRRLEETVASGRLIDPKPYQEQLAALQPDIAELQRLDAISVQAARVEGDLNAAAARLLPAVDDLDRLLSAHLPDLSALTRHADRLRNADDDSRAAATALSVLEAEATKIASQISAMQQQGTLVTRTQIGEARVTRDGLWQAFASSPKTASAQAKNVSNAIQEADRLADLALTDADRVARHAQLRLREEQLAQELETARTLSFESDKALEAERKAFREVFEPSGVKPLSPERMIDWRRGVDSLVKQRDALNDINDELAELRLKEDRLAPVLMSMVDATGCATGAGLPPLALNRALQRHVEILTDRWTDSRSLDGQRSSVRESIEKLERREAEIRVAIRSFEIAFSDAAGAIGLAEGATIEMAEAALDIWKSLPEMLTERENRRRRVRGMQRDTMAFAEAVGALVGSVAPELKALAADAAIEALHERAVAANGSDRHLADLQKQQRHQELRLSRCRGECAVIEADLLALTSAISPSGDFGALVTRLGARERLQQRLMESRTRFAVQSDGVAEPQLRADLNGFDRVAADLQVEHLEAQDKSQMGRFAELNVRLSENQRQRQILETGTSAELAVFQKFSSEAEAKDLARQWLVLKLAGSLLSSSLETYRDRQADPVMRRAGEVFSVLTGGSFARLVQLYDDKDELQLRAERRSGEKVPISGLSEGTGDQLYLALRLAFLEDYATRNEPAPLIVDDIFQTFDDDRTASGLRALAGTSSRFQTILFTHEMSVVDIATRELGKDLDLIRL